jgi:quinol monooxygenase YgiN
VPAYYSRHVLAVTRYRVAPDDAEAFRVDAAAALAALAARPGCTGATLGRAVDDPRLWTLTTSWESVGAYRRALSAYEVKLVAVPLMYRALDEPSAYEPLLTWTPDGGLAEHRPALSSDGTAAPGGRDVGRDAGVTPHKRSG